MNAEKTGSLISELRKEKNMTQKQLADLLYVSDKAVSRWETGKGLPEIGIMEDLSRVLDISMVELFKGERMDDVSAKQMKEFADEGLMTYRDIFDHLKIRFFISGFLMSMMILILVLVHLHSPIYFTSSAGIVRIETVADTKLVAVLDSKVCDVDLEEVHDEDDCVFISCYTTRWHELFGKKEEKLAVIGEVDEVDYVYYYPGEHGDELIYSDGGTPSYSVETLPRLVYNYWILIGLVLSFVSVSVYVLVRKKYFSKTVFKIASFIVSFTVSTILIVKGNATEVYNASYYLSGILLLALCMTLFIDMVCLNMKKR